MATITARMTARKGTLANLPKLLPGEIGLVTDYQQTFMGQEPVKGSVSSDDATSSTVEFISPSGHLIDLDEITTTDLAYGITITNASTNPATHLADIPGANITFIDNIATFNHTLSSDPSGDNDIEYHLWYNKEIGYHAEAFPNPEQIIKFTATSGVAQATGIEFLCDNKKSVTIDYTLSTTSASRRGTLTMLLDNASGVPSTSSIKDEYDISTGAIPVEFSLADNSTDRFILNFKTTDTVNEHTFTYVQKSFK
tara:strand:- start:670 stop:1431 length:762 start_codon:yes stop_codon:yes gene_type:complete